MSHRSRLVIALVSTGLIGYIAVGSLLGRALGDTSYGQLAIFNEVLRLVLDAYVEPVNLDRAMAGARLGMADALDGDSSYLDAEQYKLLQQPAAETDADVGLVLTRRFAFLMVVAARPGSPAAKAGLQPGDLVKAIDERHTRPLPAPVAERMLRGAPGSSVKLSVLRAGADPFDVTVVRERLKPAAPAGRMLDATTGYVRVAEFSRDHRPGRARARRDPAARRGPGARARPARRGVGRAGRRGRRGGAVPARRAGGEARRAPRRREAAAGRRGANGLERPAGGPGDERHGRSRRGGGRGARRRLARQARGRAHLRARGDLEDAAPARGRPGADGREVHVPQGHLHPRPGPGALGAGGAAETRTRPPKGRPGPTASSRRPSRC